MDTFKPDYSENSELRKKIKLTISSYNDHI